MQQGDRSGTKSFFQTLEQQVSPIVEPILRHDTPSDHVKSGSCGIESTAPSLVPPRGSKEPWRVRGQDTLTPYDLFSSFGRVKQRDRSVIPRMVGYTVSLSDRSFYDSGVGCGGPSDHKEGRPSVSLGKPIEESRRVFGMGTVVEGEGHGSLLGFHVGDRSQGEARKVGHPTLDELPQRRALRQNTSHRKQHNTGWPSDLCDPQSVRYRGSVTALTTPNAANSLRPSLGPRPTRVSVIIPAFDAVATLAEQLEALSGQMVDGAWEVLVSDNGSTDATRQLAESFRNRLPNLRVLDASQRRGAAHARNRGAFEAYGNVLLFCDADDVVAPHWVEAMTRGAENHGFVASRFEVERLNSPSVASAHRHPQERGLNPYTYPDFLPHAGGAGLGVLRSLHEEVDGFDESRLALEDTDYCWRLQQAGHALSFAGDAVVHVRFKESLRADFRQLLSYGVHNVRIYRDYQDRGMKRLPWFAGLIRWAKLLLTSPKLLTNRSRASWVGQFGWRTGRLLGSLWFRVWSL